MPPLPPVPPPQFQTFSEVQVPPGPVVLSVVPPTEITYGELQQASMLDPTGYASLSPAELKNAIPCAASCWNSPSVLPSVPYSHEALTWWTVLSLAMRLKIVSAEPPK